MRLRPPDTNKDCFTIKEFKDHIFAHTLVKKDCEMPVLDAFYEICEEYGEWQGLDMFMALWPSEYQMAAHGIFLEVILDRMSTIERSDDE